MKFEGKPCGICGTKLSSFTEEISEGVYVDAYKCQKGHVSYSEEVMRKVEALSRDQTEERRIVRVGSSLAIPIPSAIVKSLRLKPKEIMYVKRKDNEIIMRPSQF